MDGKNKLCVSNEILEEYIEILQRLTDNETAEYVVKTILNSPFVELITPFYHFNLITVDPDDNKFVDCAISANAHYIVTNDHHYDVLKDIDFPKVNIVNIQQFCIYLSQENNFSEKGGFIVRNISITDMYMSVLSSLSVDEKLDLIAKLPNSIRNTYTKEQDIETEDPFACYEGDWGGNMSAEEYADDLRKP